MFYRGEVSCIIELDEEGKPFVSEALLLDGNDITRDEMQLLYLQKSTDSMQAKDREMLEQFLQEVKWSGNSKRQLTTVEEEESVLEEAEGSVSCFAKKYKLVALKVRPVLGTLPERFRITREIVGDLLKGIPTLPERPPEFQLKGCYSLERKVKLDAAHSEEFLWSEERKLMHWLVAEQNEAFAWDDTERGKFKEEFFPPIEIPTVAHIPWVEKPFRIPPAIYDEVCQMIKRKIDARVYEPSNSSYRSRWFCVIKKDGKSLRLVHSLELLNKVTIAHSGLPPVMSEVPTPSRN